MWYHSGMPPVALRWVVVRDPTGAVEAKGFLSTDPGALPFEVIAWYVRRWSVEVTFAEARRHLGVETQRQWSELATLRTTPCLLGLFSVDGASGRRTPRLGRAPHPAERVVPEGHADVQRCAGGGADRAVAAGLFPHVRPRGADGEERRTPLRVG